MRRILSILLASTALFSCSTEEVINAPELQPISFGNMFIENSTRAIYNQNEDLKLFYVYGNVTGNQNSTVILYGNDGAKVERNNGVSWNGIWDCKVTQYWVPECTYQFAAVSNAKDEGVTVETNDNGLPEIITYNVASQADLLYASVPYVTTDFTGTPSGTGIDNKTVAFTFNHLLSKVRFVFINDFPEASGVELTATDIKITNATASGTYGFNSDLKKWEWTSLSGETSLEFDRTEKMSPGKGEGISSKECVLIPGTNVFKITLYVQHNIGKKEPVLVDDITLTADLRQGCSYNFRANLNAGNITGIAPITFNITRDDDWNDAEDFPKDTNL